MFIMNTGSPAFAFAAVSFPKQAEAEMKPLHIRQPSLLLLECVIQILLYLSSVVCNYYSWLGPKLIEEAEELRQPDL